MKKPITSQAQNILGMRRKLDAKTTHIRRLEQRIADMRKELTDLQWHYEPHDDHYHKPQGFYCPRCGGEKDTGHKDCCTLAPLLKTKPQAGLNSDHGE